MFNNCAVSKRKNPILKGSEDEKLRGLDVKGIARSHLFYIPMVSSMLPMMAGKKNNMFPVPPLCANTKYIPYLDVKITVPG